ncbi:unnamed protein product [Cuscuta epithymum]|uniref:RNA-binding protein 42-like n=1 Tax=Cuscuta epithymum TaxID=186058 RepID=A0AAV0GHZ1_9ASTE|nr:unnamed protein product [Cuscuta epithymum]
MSAVGSSLSQYTYPNGTYFPTPFHLQQQQPQAYIGPASLPPVQVPVPSVVPAVYPVTAPLPSTSLSQYQQANQLFQRVAQIVTPEAIENVKAALASSEIEQKADAKKKAVHRKAAGQTWEDPTLADWPENDYRLFCGDLGNEVNDDVLSKAFSRFRSFNMARIYMLLRWHVPICLAFACPSIFPVVHQGCERQKNRQNKRLWICEFFQPFRSCSSP